MFYINGSPSNKLLQSKLPNHPASHRVARRSPGFTDLWFLPSSPSLKPDTELWQHVHKTLKTKDELSSWEMLTSSLKKRPAPSCIESFRIWTPAEWCVKKKELHVWIIQLRLGGKKKKVFELKVEIILLLQTQKHTVHYLALLGELMLMTNLQWLVQQSICQGVRHKRYGLRTCLNILNKPGWRGGDVM